MESIRSAIAQASNYLIEHPEAATSSDSAATAVLEDGLRFRVDGPGPSLTTDMAKSVGGNAEGPTPAWLMRAALASCDATLVAMEAARDGIDLTDLTVTVESESDFRGVLGVDPTIQPGPLSMRVDRPRRQPGTRTPRKARSGVAGAKRRAMSAEQGARRGQSEVDVALLCGSWSTG